MDFNPFRLAGFSQSTAFSYGFMLQYPEREKSVASIAGFLPEGAKEYLRDANIGGLPIEVFQGTQDKQVPIGRVREDKITLSQAGAEVTFRDLDVGH